MSTPISLAALLERFFTQRLMQQRQASPHTISSYRDTFQQFLKFTEQRLRKEPSRLVFQEAPTHSAQIQRVLAIPSKRFTRTLVQFLTRAEVDALLAAPD